MSAPLAPLTRLVRRVGPGVMDAATTSVRNLVVGVVAAHALDLDGFGWFSTAVLVQLVATGASKAVHADPFVLAHGAARGRQRRTLAAGTAGTALVAGAAAAVLLAVTGAAAQSAGADALGGVLLAVAVVLPSTLLVDVLRWVAHSGDRGPLAVGAAVLGGAVSVAAVAAVAAAGAATAPTLVLAAGLGTVPAAALLVRRLQVVPRTTGAARWYRTHRGWSGRLALDWLLLQLTAEGALLLVAALTTAAQVGELRKAQLPLAPAVVLTTGLVVFLQPALSRAAAAGGSADATARRARLAALAVGGVTGAYVLVVALAPAGWVDLLVGGDWDRARAYVWPLGLALTAGAAAAPLGIGLRVLGRLGDQVRWRLWLAAPVLAGTATSALLGGALVAAWWIAGATVVVAAVWLLLTGLPARVPDADADAGPHAAGARPAPAAGPVPAPVPDTVGEPGTRPGTRPGTGPGNGPGNGPGAADPVGAERGR